MKKKIIIIFLALICCIACLGLVACGHKHQYEDRVSPTTCTEDGYTEHVCSCGDSYRDNVVAARHTINSVPEKSATCTEEGHSVYYECTQCGKWFGDEGGQNEITDKDSVITAAIPHTISLVPEKEATCAEEGYTAHYECTQCGKWFGDEGGQNEITDKDSLVIATIPHNISLVPEKPATCTETGYSAHYECSQCGKWFNLSLIHI